MNRDALAALVSEVDRLRRMTFKERLQDMQLRKNLERQTKALEKKMKALMS
jgi:hypothetical protein